MDFERHYRKLEHMYKSALVNTRSYRGSTIEISSGSAEIKWKVEEDFFHGLGALHGSVYFKLLDDAAFFAIQSEITDYFILTSSFNITFVRPVTEGILTARGRIRSRSKSIFSAESVLLNQRGKEVGYGSGQFVRSGALLSETAGYTLPQ